MSIIEKISCGILVAAAVLVVCFMIILFYNHYCIFINCVVLVAKVAAGIVFLGVLFEITIAAYLLS